MKTSLLSDDIGVVGTIDPDAKAAGTYLSDWVAAADFGKYVAVINAGVLGTNATINAKLRQATDSTGSGAEDITGKAITELSQAGTDESGKIALINLDPSELDVNNGFTHFAVSLTVGTAASDVGATILGASPRHDAPADNDLADVAEIVA